jgi:transposase-like protein
VPKPITKKTEVIPSPDNEQRQRRKFTASQKARILAEADACERGQLSILLRREGIYSSQLGSWRAQQEQHGLEGLANSKPGPKVTIDAKDRVIEKLERRNERLEKELRIAKALIDMQKKAHEIMGIALPKMEDDDENASSSSSSSARRKFR